MSSARADSPRLGAELVDHRSRSEVEEEGVRLDDLDLERLHAGRREVGDIERDDGRGVNSNRRGESPTFLRVVPQIGAIVWRCVGSELAQHDRGQVDHGCLGCLGVASEVDQRRRCHREASVSFCDEYHVERGVPERVVAQPVDVL